MYWVTCNPDRSGDGTLKGAMAIGEHAKTSGYSMSVIGIPKTVDNDILYLEKVLYTLKIDFRVRYSCGNGTSFHSSCS